jgi:hypothetical protein
MGEVVVGDVDELVLRVVALLGGVVNPVCDRLAVTVGAGAAEMIAILVMGRLRKLAGASVQAKLRGISWSAGTIPSRPAW